MEVSTQTPATCASITQIAAGERFHTVRSNVFTTVYVITVEVVALGVMQCILPIVSRDDMVKNSATCGQHQVKAIAGALKCKAPPVHCELILVRKHLYIHLTGCQIVSTSDALALLLSIQGGCPLVGYAGNDPWQEAIIARQRLHHDLSSDLIRERSVLNPLIRIVA